MTADVGAITTDDAAALEVGDALAGGASRQADPPGQGFDRDACFPRQDFEYFPIFGVKVAHGLLALRPDICRLIPTVCRFDPTGYLLDPAGYLMPENRLRAKLSERKIAWKNNNYD